jgi:hypothetical protein
MLLRKICSISVLCFVSVGFIGCALADMKETRSGASIIEKGSGWKISHPRDNSTGKRLDWLENRDMKLEIRFERNFFKGEENKPFLISVEFIELKAPVDFMPSRITLRRNNSEILRAKAISCYNKKWDIENLRLNSAIVEPVHVDKEDRYHMVGKPCYTLFFDYPAPPVEEEFILFMNDAFTSNSVKMDIPPIYFRKTIDNNIRFGFGVE